MRVLLFLCVVLAGCDPAPTPAKAPAPRTAPHGKPTAAVEVRLDAVDRGGGDYDVTLTATPTVATDALELVLDGRKVAAGAVAAGEARTMTTRIHLGGRGREVLGSAAVGQGNRRRNRAASTWIGAPQVAPAQTITIITMPDGSEVAEVRE